MQKQPGSVGMSAKNSGMSSRREFIQAAAYIVGGCGIHNRPSHGVDLFVAKCGANPAYLSWERIAATPAFRYRAYRSKRSRTPDATSWVQIDLGRVGKLDCINIFPANQYMYPGKGQDQNYSGEGFPLRFKIQVADEPLFERSCVIVDHSNEDLASPDDSILSFPCNGLRARYVRLTSVKFSQPLCAPPPVDPPEACAACGGDERYWFALAKIGVVSDGEDIAIGKPLTCDDALGNPSDLGQLTRPPRIESEFVRRDNPRNVTDPMIWKRIPYAAQVPVSGVTLYGGIFESAMRKNIAYLLKSFSVDDLLLQFRGRAGRPIPASTRNPDQFWESDLAGSNAGRFLMGAGNTLRWIEEGELRDRLKAVVDGIADCRESDGYMMAYPRETIFYSERGGYTRAWLTHGLIEAGYMGNAQAFSLLRAHHDWFNRCEYLPNLMRGANQGGQGMISSTRLYFTPVGKPADVQVIQRYFLEKRWLAALAKGNKDEIWQYPYDRPHCYLLTNLEAYLDLYRATGEQVLYDGVRAAWEMFRKHWQHAGGSISIIEYEYDPPDAHSLGQKLGELCGSSFWVFLSQRFQLMDPTNERYATEIEKSIYNVALANQDGTNGLRYHTVLVGKKEKGTQKNTCCEGQGTRLIGSLPEHIYSIAPDGLFINLFEPSSISWKHDGVEVAVRMDSKFPFEREIELTITAAQPTHMSIHLRVPSWATDKMEIRGGDSSPIFGSPGSFVTVERTWSGRELVTFSVPIGFVLTEYSGVDQLPGHKRYALTYGPLLYACVGSEDIVLRVAGGSRAEDILHQLSPKPDAPLQFTVAENPGVTYIPYWQVDTETFTCFPAIEVVASQGDRV